jgi:hypothetical protein
VTDTPESGDTSPADAVAESPSEHEAVATGPEAAEESVRFGLVLTRGGGVLLERTVTSEGATVWALPSVEVAPAEPFGVSAVEVESSRFFPVRALPDELSEEARAAFSILSQRPAATEEDGSDAAAGVVVDSPRSLPPALPHLAADGEAPGAIVPRSAGRLVFVASMVCAGGVAWASGVAWALATTRLVREDVALAAWLCGVGGAVLLGVHEGLGGQNAAKVGSQATRTVFTLLLGGATTAVLLLFAAWFGGQDEARSAFWLWAFGALTLALALRRVDDAAVAHVWPQSWRVAAWTAATCASITVVFPPLRAALFSRGDAPSSSDATAPTDDD